ncbi:MAG: DUF2339 domain-containing protein [Bacteroidales bacterium]|nr:DUF2339 domain-containing protein [Bacteroidales bacterium]
MNKDQKIYELQQKIDLLETQKQSLQEQLNKVGYEFHDFKSKYTYVMSEMSTQLSSLSESINSLRNELTVLTTAETEPEPVVTDPVYETCSTGIEKSTVVSDSVESTVKPEQVEAEPVQESVQTEPVQEAAKTEPVQESVQTEPVQESVQTEPVQEAVQTEPVQEAVQTEPVQEAVQTEPVQETVKTEYTQKTAATEAQRSTSAESRQSAPSKPQEETIFDKLRDNFDWEKFIGENLIMKLGILIVLIGVAIGGKYALEHQLLSPTMRIIIGTLFGAALQGVAIKLKKEYKKLSAVLASGAMATLYFMTYFAYDFYGLIPMPVAFVLMTLITVATVWQACTYDMEVIAIIGLVAAYVIPFMLSTGEGSPWALFSYISIINAGVMFISVKRYWRILFVSAYVSSWFIYGVVYRTLDFPETSDAVKLLLFLFINFVIFYVTFLAYKVKHKMIFQNFDIVYLLSNSFMFFGLGYNVMFNNETLASYVAWFSFANALIHGIVAFILIKKNMVDKSVYRLITGLAISFVTIAIMVWATGHWLTMFWMLEGTVLFTVSRISKRPFYEKMSYPVFFLALISLIIDWGNPNGGHLRMLTPLFEAFASYRSMWDTTTAAVQGNALSIINTVVFIMLCIFIGVVDNRYPMVEDEETQNSWMNLANKCLRVMAVFVVTAAILVHIERPWLTMVWMLEATILFTFARVRKNVFFEKSAYPVFALAFSSLLVDWGNPNVDHLKVMTPFFNALTSPDAVSLSSVLAVVNTLVFIALSVFVVVVEHRYPVVESEETKDSWIKDVAEYLKVMAVFVVTTAILVHIERPWLTMCWMLEATLLFGFSRIRKMLFYEKSAYPVFTLAVISLLVDWGNPNAEHLDFMTFWFENSCPAGYGYALYVTNTVVCIILTVCAAVLNYRYPLKETEETKDSFVSKSSQFLSVMAIFVVTAAIFVHIEQPWMTVLWCAEALLLCYLGRTKSICLVERGAYVMVALSSIAFLNVWNDLPYPYDFESRIEKFENNFGIRLSEIWTSVVAGLSLVATLVGQIWMINKFKLEKDGVAERFDLNFKLKFYLVAVLAFFIWTHTPWVITTALLFGLALLSLIFALRDDARLKKAFVAVFGLGIFCWLCDVFTAYESTFGDDGGLSTNTKQIIMLLGSVIDVALIYMMRRYNEMPKFEASKISWFPFIALLVLMPFVAVGYVYCYHVGSWMEHQTLDNRVAIRLFTSFVFCFAMAYFSTWTFVSLKYKLNDFKKFTMTCLCLVLFAKLFVGLFDLRIRGEEVDFNVIHLFSLVLTLFSAWTLYLYKKQEKCMFGMSEETTTKAFDTFLFFGFVAVGGKELNKLCCLVGSPEAFGVAFSVFLGIVSLFGVYYGLYKDKKYLRIEGFVLLGFTLLKLFFYDMARFDQIYKVIALISLGLLMLVMAFFYQKIAKEKEKMKAQELPKTGEISNDDVQPKDEDSKVEAE